MASIPEKILTALSLTPLDLRFAYIDRVRIYFQQPFWYTCCDECLHAYHQLCATM